ncbi:MAG: twin-arginine translocase TatA/TatE family subunit [Chloroflexota bacterium]|nr:twin-arginine translocase TatA/TatE family subunit [Chloroflexota bacterium]
MPHPGPLEIGLILVIVLIVFGVGRLPQVGGALGKSIREFRRERENFEADPIHKTVKEPQGESVVLKSTEVQAEEKPS